MSNRTPFLFDLNSPPHFVLNKKVFSLSYFTTSQLNQVFDLEQEASLNPWSLKNFASSIESSHHCISLACDDELIAHAVLSFAAGEAELLILSVKKTWQGRRIATHFLQCLMLLCAEKAQQMFLEVRESNAAAIKLYESMGFHVVGERQNYYPADTGRENALIYATQLFLE